MDKQKKIELLKQQIATARANQLRFYDDLAEVSIQQDVEIELQKELDEIERENQEADDAWNRQNIFERE